MNVREVEIRYKPVRGYRHQCDGPTVAVELFRDFIGIGASQERFCALYLDGAHKVIGIRLVSQGLANTAPVHPREVYQPAVLLGAVAVIVAHNHPSQECVPSREDISATERLKQSGDLLGIRLLDSLIVTDTEYRSILGAI